MANFTSKPVRLNASAQKTFDTFSDLNALKNLLSQVPADQVPEDKREMFEKLNITDDSIVISGAPTGDLTLRMARKEAPTLISLEGFGTPVPLSLTMHIKPIDDNSCEASAEISLGIPNMMKAMVAKPMQNVVDQFAQVLAQVPLG